MSYDLDLLRVVANKVDYVRFKDHIKKHNVSSITLDIFNVMGEYWDNYPTHTVVDWPTLKTFFFIVKSKKIKDVTPYNLVFDNLEKLPSTHLKEAILSKLIEMDYATHIYNEVLGISTGSVGKSITNIGPLLLAYNKEVGAVTKREDVFVSPSLSYISSIVSSPGLKWRLKEFNVSLGPLRRGDFIIMAARPESGKTTMVASEATYMMTQLAPDEHVIWINNEESSPKVMMRCIQAFSQVTSGELLKDTSKYETAFLAAGGNRFLILDDDSPIKTAHKMDALFQEFKPGLIVFDQLDKVDGFYNEREDLRIGHLYEWARNVAKTYCPVIAISQVDGTGEGEKWIKMNQLRGSKTDKVGEADAIVTIGKSNEAGMDLDRFIHVPKNKLFGGPESIEVHRHGTFEVTIEPARARFISKWK
jgi:replicative DNA helicase